MVRNAVILFVLGLQLVNLACDSSPVKPAGPSKSELMSDLRSGRNWLIRKKAAAGLKRYDDKESLQLLHQTLLKDRSSRVKLAVLETLGKRKDQNSVAFITPYTHSTDILTKAAAYSALCEYGSADLINYYRRASRDRDWMVRRQSLKCFRRLPGERSKRKGFDRALFLSLDPVLAVQKEALSTLSWYDHPRTPDFLVRFSYQKNLTPAAMWILLDAMREYSDNRRVRRRLYELQDSKSMQVRLIAREILQADN